jgi:hypothetical protein
LLAAAVLLVTESLQPAAVQTQTHLYHCC